MNKINKLMILILMSSWGTPSSSMEENAAKFNLVSVGKRKRERDITPPTNQAKVSINLEPEKKKVKRIHPEEQTKPLSFQLSCDKFMQKAESGDTKVEQGVALKPLSFGPIYLTGQSAANSDIRKEVESLTNAAENGHALAQYQLSMMCFKGQVILQDSRKGTELLSKAAENGYTPAQYQMGRLYIKGSPYVGCDFHKGIEILTKAAEKGYAMAQYRLGKIYYYGKYIVIPNGPKAVEFFTKAAEQGHTSAQHQLGYMYQHGHSVIKTPSKAVEYFTKAADKGYALSQAQLGSMYQTGVGVERDLKKAAQLYLRSFSNPKIRIPQFGDLFTFNQQTSQTSQSINKQLLNPQIEALKEILIPIHANSTHKIDFAGGGSTNDTYGNNPILQKLARQEAVLCKSLITLLENLIKIIERPGYFITCLDIQQRVDAPHNLNKLCCSVDGDKYISFYGDNLMLLQRNWLAEILKKERDENVRIKNLLESALSTPDELDPLLREMVLREDSLQSQPSVLSTYLEKYFALNDLEDKKAYLEKLMIFLTKQEQELSDQIEKAEEVYSTIASIIKETTGYRNALFAEKIWKRVNPA